HVVQKQEKRSLAAKLFQSRERAVVDIRSAEKQSVECVGVDSEIEQPPGAFAQIEWPLLFRQEHGRSGLPYTEALIQAQRPLQKHSIGENPARPITVGCQNFRQCCTRTKRPARRVIRMRRISSMPARIQPRKDGSVRG